MFIIQKQPNLIGVYPIQSWNEELPPDTHYEIICDFSECFDGFIIPTITDGKVTSYACNIEAWNTWKAAQATKTTKIEITADERIAALEAAIIDLMGVIQSV